jgi:diguanylate cyclase (GGDEF)-like protein
MNILVADDDPVSRRMLEVFLGKWNFEPVLARDGNEAWNILQGKDSPKMAILDWMMPGVDGATICRQVRELHDHSYVYILLLTTKFQKSDVIAGLDAGADDFLAKPFDPAELRSRLKTGRRIIDLQEKLQHAYEDMKYLASHDPLTGLDSRAAILETLKLEIIRAQRQQSMIGVLLVDLDYFKQVNESYGYLAGDAILRETVNRIRAAMLPYDAIGRYGGDEFLLVMPGCELASTLSQAEDLRAAVAKAPIEAVGIEVPMTVSLGVTVGGGEQGLESNALLKAADLALYEAKRNGRNRVELCRENWERPSSVPLEFR